MRKRFEQHFILGQLPICDTEIPTQKRSGALPGLCAALKEIFITPKWNKKVFEVLEKKIQYGKKRTGRPGMDLWQIFVLSQVRLCQNISYDDVRHVANYDSLVRQIMGVESGFGYEKVQFKYQTIVDNVSLLDDETVKGLNDIIVEFGHEVFKKKESTALRLKTDSFVVESNVHFPTDYNLLWDSARKSIDMVNKFQEKYNMPGWRKIKNWRNDLKNKMRALGQASVSGGKGKPSKVKQAARAYLAKAKALYQKFETSKNSFPQEDITDVLILMELERFMKLLRKHIDLVERRLIKEEVIPHQEKMFSIFEDYTEWITKGKMRPNVELGKKAAITTDQFHLIVDYRVMDHQADSGAVPGIAEKLLEKYSVNSWSFDKGFWHKENKALLAKSINIVVMPKKGKRNIQEQEEERRISFKTLKNKHSAIESNINELECRGLNRCPDRGLRNFKRYVGLAISAYNLRRIGTELIAHETTAGLKEKSRKPLAA